MGRTRSSTRHAIRRRLVPSIISALLVVAAAAAPTSAAAQAITVDRVLASGSMDLGGATYTISGLVSGTITVSAEATVTFPIRETLAFDDASLRQGGALAVGRTVAPNGAATVKVIWTVAGTGDFGGLSTTRTKTQACALSFVSAVTCALESGGIRIFGAVPVPFTPFVDLVLHASVKVTPTSATVVSTELAGAAAFGGPASHNEPGTQAIAIPCTVGVGDTLALSDADYAFATHVDSTNGPAIEIGAWLPIPLPPFIVEGPTVSFDVGAQRAASFDQNLTDATIKASALGPIAANNVPPNANAGGPYSGNEGSPIQFDAGTSTSICGFNSLAFRWDFSDGGVAYGAKPWHTFTDNAVFSGQLTATDPTGLSNTESFSVTVTNLAPIANAGPDTTADWGRLVTFGGTATDPGAGDQSTLQYSWDFGDGTPPTTPSGSGGSGVFHAYATPGLYTATMTVVDKDGGSGTDARTVNVTKRDTTTAYLGDTAGTYDTPGQLSASLVDEYGVNLNDKSIAFTVNGVAAGSVSTNSSGIAMRSYTPLLPAASYGTGAAFGGDVLYNGSADTGSIAIARKATSVTYTGALNGGANKTISLLAILADATGTRLANRQITFKLGTQSVSVNTDANGVAFATLKLAQKNGIYPLTATFTPAGPDAGTYLASSDAKSFKLQTK